MRRGDIVTVADRGHYSGKPRPALVIQSDLFDELASVTLALLSSQRVDAPLIRIDVAASPTNGLNQDCQVMIDKTVTVPREKVGDPIGSLDRETLVQVDRSLAVFLGIA
jgi:mRNA interferase MazF